MLGAHQRVPASLPALTGFSRAQGPETVLGREEELLPIHNSPIEGFQRGCGKEPRQCDLAHGENRLGHEKHSGSALWLYSQREVTGHGLA